MTGILLTTSQAARMLGVSPSTICRWSLDGAPTEYTAGGHRRFCPLALRAWLESEIQTCTARGKDSAERASTGFDPYGVEDDSDEFGDDEDSDEDDADDEDDQGEDDEDDDAEDDDGEEEDDSDESDEDDDDSDDDDAEDPDDEDDDEEDE